MNRPTLTPRTLGVAIAVSVIAGAAAIGGRWSLVLAALAGALLGWGVIDSRRLNFTILGIAFLAPATVDFGYPTFPEWTVLGALLALCVWARILRLDRDGWQPTLIMAALATPAAVLVASTAHWRGVGPLVAAAAPLACYGLLAWHFAEEARHDPAEIRRLASAFAWIGVPIALLAVYQRASGTWPLLDQYAVDVAFTAAAGPGRSAGVMGHPILYGTYCMAMACVALVLRGRLWGIPFAANVIGLVLSGTRSAWIGMAVALVGWYLVQPRKFSRRGVAIGGAAAVVAAGLWAFGPPAIQHTIDILKDRLANLTGSQSAVARYARSGAAWDRIWDNPATVLFGHGPEGHVTFFRTIGIDDGLAQAFDNSYLTLWYDFGAVGLLCFVVLLAALWWRFRSLVGRLLLLAFAVQIYFFDFFLWPCAGAVLALAVGLAVADRAGWAPVGPRDLVASVRDRIRRAPAQVPAEVPAEPFVGRVKVFERPDV